MGYNITITAPPTEPTINSVTENAGNGTFAAGTYKLAFIGATGGYVNADDTLTMFSAVVYDQITIAANSAIDYSATPDASASYLYILIMSIDSGSQDGEWLAPNGFFSPTTLKNSGTITGYQHTGVIYAPHPLRFEQYESKPYGVPLDKGTPKIEIKSDGAGGLLYFEDVIEAVNNSSLTEGEHYVNGGNRGLYGYFIIDSYNTDAGQLRLDNIDVLMSWRIWNKDSNLTWQSYRTGANTTFIKIVQPGPSSVYGIYSYMHNIELRDVIIGGIGKDGYVARWHWNLTDGSIMVNCMIGGWHYSNLLEICKGSWIRGLIANGIIDPGSEIGANTIETTTFFCNGSFSFRGTVIKFRYGQYRFLLYPQANSFVTKLYDVTIYLQTYYSDASWLDAPEEGFGWLTESINVYTYAGEGDNQHSLEFYFSMNLTVKDINNTVVQGATVTCTDVYDNTVFQTDTDENGEISEDVLVYLVKTVIGTSRGYLSAVGADTTDYNPFTFTIEEPGYQTIEFTKAITEQFNDILFMAPDAANVYVDRAISGDVSDEDIEGDVSDLDAAGSIALAELTGEIEVIEI